MRKSISVFLVAISVCVAVVAAADGGELDRLEKAKRVFDLRRALDQNTNADSNVSYYRALVDARFGREEIAVGKLRAFLAASPTDEMALKAHAELADALIRMSRYGDAVTEYEQLLRLMPASDSERGSVEDARAIFSALKDVDPQTAEFGSDTPLMAKTNKLGLWSVPVEVNGTQAEWVLDTGMTSSTVTGSEAKRLGLKLLDSGGLGSSNHTGKELPFRFAVASDLRIGAAHLRNVAVAVVADNALNFGSERLRGVIGLPVIRALGSIAVSATGGIRIHASSPQRQPQPNMFFDGLSLIVEIRHAGEDVPLTLDTGGTTTYLYSTFRKALTPVQIAGLHPQKRRFSGIGGSTEITTELVPQLELELPGRTVGLREVALRSDSSPYSDGLLGMDALKGRFTIDFRDMRFEAD